MATNPIIDFKLFALFREWETEHQQHLDGRFVLTVDKGKLISVFTLPPIEMDKEQPATPIRS